MRNKKLIVIIAFCISRLLCFSQVSINTTRTSGMFYIDAAANNDNDNLPLSDRQKDDVEVDAKGFLILGQKEETKKLAKVNITSSSAYGALRISDGNEGDGKILYGNKDGFASWGLTKGNGGYLKKVYAPLSDLKLEINKDYPLQFDYDATSGLTKDYLEMTSGGNYVILVRSFFTYTEAQSNTATVSFDFKLRRIAQSGNTEDTIDSANSILYIQPPSGTSTNGASSSTILRLNGVNQSDKIRIYLVAKSAGLSLDPTRTQLIIYKI